MPQLSMPLPLQPGITKDLLAVIHQLELGQAERLGQNHALNGGQCRAHMPQPDQATEQEGIDQEHKRQRDGPSAQYGYKAMPPPSLRQH